MVNGYVGTTASHVWATHHLKHTMLGCLPMYDYEVLVWILGSELVIAALILTFSKQAREWLWG